MIELGLRLLEQALIFNGEENTQSFLNSSSVPSPFAPVFSSSRDVEMECQPNPHSSCICEPCITENKDPEIVMVSQVLVCALTGHIEITAKTCGNTATNPQ